MKIKIQHIITLSLISFATSASAESPEIHKKDGVKLGDETFNLRFLKYSPPIEYKKMKPVKGDQPDWAKAAEVIQDYHLYTYADMTNCLTQTYITKIGLTEESFEKMKTEKLEGKYDHIPRISERYLVSEFYLINKSHEYLIVKFDESAAWTKYHGKKAGGFMSKIYEKIDGSWKDITCDASSLDWYKAIPYESENFMALFK